MAAAADWGKGGEGEEGRDAVITATNCAGTVYKPGDAKNIAGKYGFNKYVALKVLLPRTRNALCLSVAAS